MWSDAKVGDTVWVADAGSVQKSRPCRVCAGNRTVTLILGTGEDVALDCQMCAAGYEAPTGTETFYEYDAAPKPYRVSAVEVVETSTGREVTYRSGSDNGYYNLDAAKCYATADEALEACAELIAEREREVEKRLAQKEGHTNKSYAWHAGYHLREAKKARKSAEYHETKAVLLKAKSKEAPRD